MITDNIGAEYYQRLGIDHIWDLGVDAVLDDMIDDAILPLSFWAAGKIFALQSQNAPCAMIDTDFIVWKSIEKQLNGEKLAVIHREEITYEIYPEKSFFDMVEDYQFPVDWDWSVSPCNTAFLYIADNEFKNYYTGKSIEFMKNMRWSKNITTEMVFAEQRLLAMCAVSRNIPIKSLLDVNGLENQKIFTHVWGFKSELQTKLEKRREFCINCVKRIAADFPKELPVLEQIESITPYFPKQGAIS
jgi:hypothetical protein